MKDEKERKSAAQPPRLDWQTLVGLPEFAEFYRLIRRLFGMDIALLSPDARQGSLLGPGREINPFCRAVQLRPEGLARCRACDREHASLAHRGGHPLRYTCHAGLTEFIIPVIVDGEVLAHLQCGQILDRPVEPGDWQRIRKRLDWAGGRDLASAFRRTRVLSAATQEDLISLLKLIAQHTATAHARKLLLEQAPGERIVTRTQTLLKQRFREELSIGKVASAVGASRRNLTRLLRQQTGASLLEHVHRLRIAHACDMLQNRNLKIAEIALACGFGSIQQFNRIFRKRTGRTPTRWRARLRTA